MKKKSLTRSAPPSGPVSVRRQDNLVSMTFAAAALLTGARSGQSDASTFANLTQNDASAAVRAALERGAVADGKFIRSVAGRLQTRGWCWN
ncbi:MAG: hypothetical protein ACKO15_02990 [Burkholderiales bacterium]